RVILSNGYGERERNLDAVSAQAAARGALSSREQRTKGTKRMRFRIALGAVMVMGLCAVVAAGIASAAPPNNYTCSGGSIPGGNYASITVTGFCDVVPDAVINVSGNINVAPDALF